MRTLRRYFSLTEACLAKTLLDNYEVVCSVFDENVNALGYYIVMPARLMVAGGQLQRAARILAFAQTSEIPADDVAAAADQFPVMVIEEDMFGENQPDVDDTAKFLESGNPWEILAIAYLFWVPGIGFILEQLPLKLWVGGHRRDGWLILSPLQLHLVGVALICVATILTISYFYTRQTIARERIEAPAGAGKLR